MHTISPSCLVRLKSVSKPSGNGPTKRCKPFSRGTSTQVAGRPLIRSNRFLEGQVQCHLEPIPVGPYKDPDPIPDRDRWKFFDFHPSNALFHDVLQVLSLTHAVFRKQQEVHSTLTASPSESCNLQRKAANQSRSEVYCWWYTSAPRR